jgi:hypothetical protein
MSAREWLLSWVHSQEKSATYYSTARCQLFNLIDNPPEDSEKLYQQKENVTQSQRLAKYHYSHEFDWCRHAYTQVHAYEKKYGPHLDNVLFKRLRPMTGHEAGIVRTLLLLGDNRDVRHVPPYHLRQFAQDNLRPTTPQRAMYAIRVKFKGAAR